jgi:hypothetical protein
MTLPELIEWQWADYSRTHSNKANLLIHIVGVPLFWWATIQALGGLFLMLLMVPGAFGMLFWALVSAGASAFVQFRGDLMEANPPERFSSNKDALRRILAEQYVTFPRFVASGGWLQNLKRAA